jgi:hypothetical protein
LATPRKKKQDIPSRWVGVIEKKKKSIEEEEKSRSLIKFPISNSLKTNAARRL